jgi:hypothetical protein
MPSTILTDAAEGLIALAAGNGPKVAITHIAIGDGNGANYAPDYAQTALRREKARVAITSRHMIGNNAWRVKGDFGVDTPTFDIREMGFFDAQGTLIALWAGTDIQSRQSGVFEYIVDHVLNFSRVADGLIIVDAPDDKLVEFQIATLTSLGHIRLEQFKQSEVIRAEHGHF